MKGCVYLLLAHRVLGMAGSCLPKEVVSYKYRACSKYKYLEQVLSQ